MKGVLTGALALVALQLLVTSKSSTRIAGLFGLPAAAARYLIDPNTPGIPDRRH